MREIPKPKYNETGILNPTEEQKERINTALADLNDAIAFHFQSLFDGRVMRAAFYEKLAERARAFGDAVESSRSTQIQATPAEVH